jgi:hypothetical protein
MVSEASTLFARAILANSPKGIDMRHTDRPADHSPSASRCAGTGWESRTKSGRFSIVPLLLFSRDISAEARRALVESRLRDAAGMLMHEHGLSCIEAGDLLGVAAC